MNGKSYGQLYKGIKMVAGNKSLFYTGEMQGKETCLRKDEKGELPLDQDDLYFPDEKTDFKKGDQVLLFKLTNEKYIILCKVVER
ncbi:hypothetical protein lbkm_3842 [Lachnospiraceae bacterium KM106-2]|nr:hypothetical protein lbkm_3842 [Lachnospiraceae bacterium KM106-2]